MRIAAVNNRGSRQFVLVEGDVAFDIPPIFSLLDLLRADLKRRERVMLGVRRGVGRPLTELTFLPPVRPASIRRFLTFEAHARIFGEAFRSEWSSGPPPFGFINPHSVIAHRSSVVRPASTQRFDFGVELAVVLSRSGRDISVDRAGEYIGGYTIMNGWVSRDQQFKAFKKRLGMAKSMDSATSLGPWIVTPEELDGRRRNGRLDLGMIVEVNGVTVGESRLSGMKWSFEELISEASREATISAGDVISSGPCPFGSLAEAWAQPHLVDRQRRPLEPGDVVRVSAEGVGDLSNTVRRAPVPGESR